MTADIRWQQRFQNFEKAFLLLSDALENSPGSKLEKEGVIQRFEYTFELAWKTMKDYLNFGGITSHLPRDVIKEAFAHNLIDNGQIWIEMLESRNILSHTYDESSFESIYTKITTTYFLMIKQIYLFLKEKKG